MKRLFIMMSFFAVFAGLFILTGFTGCSKNKETTPVQIEQESSDHSWYFFTGNGFEKTSLPQKSGISSLKPWTETLRASDGNTDADGNGLLLINRLGIVLIQKGGQPVLMQDVQIFSNSTASNLVFDGTDSYITLGRSSFFNKDASLNVDDNLEPNRPFVVRASVADRAFYPVVTYGDLGLAAGGEITGSNYDGKNWLCSVKTMQHQKTYFSYISWTSEHQLNSLPPYTQTSKVSVKESTEDEYRSKSSPLPLKKAPERLKKLLSAIPKEFEYAVNCHSQGGFSSRLFASANDESNLASANAIIADGWICAVFSDGTTYFNGAVDGRAVLNGGKNIAFRLPKLPESYQYGPFCISGDKLAAAWEETDFYKTGRSGFIVVDLAKIFYKDTNF
ncbi:MAG: hypothetical protein IKS30_08145 [Treponema sp.]|nr:hypothetical protein [Treponema sp.]